MPPVLGANSAGLNPSAGTFPLNQNGLPAASFTPVTSLPVAGSAARPPPPFFGEVDRVEAGTLGRLASQTTVSPTLTVTRLIMKLSTPAPYFLPMLFCHLAGPPA